MTADRTIQSVKNSLPVLTYIASHPGCIQEDVRVATVRNNATLRKILDALIDCGLVREIACRDGRRTALTAYLYATSVGVNVAYSYELTLQCSTGELDSKDVTFNQLMQERFNGAYQKALESAMNIPESDS